MGMFYTYNEVPSYPLLPMKRWVALKLFMAIQFWAHDVVIVIVSSVGKPHSERLLKRPRKTEL